MPDQPLASFDVCIAGSGLYGSTLACILAKQGLNVLILEPGRHPRFSLGEALLPRHVFDWGNPEAFSVDFSRPDVVGPLLEWGFTASPPALRRGLFDFPLPEAIA